MNLANHPFRFVIVDLAGLADQFGFIRSGSHDDADGVSADLRGELDLPVYVEEVVRRFSRYHEYELGTELRADARPGRGWSCGRTRGGTRRRSSWSFVKRSRT